MRPAPPAPRGSCWPRRRPGPAVVRGYLRSRWGLHRRYDTRGLPLLDLANIRQPLNLVFTSRAFQPGVDDFDPSLPVRRPEHRRPSGRPVVPGRSAAGLRCCTPRWARCSTPARSCCAAFATALAPLGGTVIVSTGQTDPAALGPLPANVLARRFVPQPEVLARAALFVTHGGMNSVNEAMYAGVPMLVVPQGADQPLVARRVVELGAGLSIRTRDVATGLRARPRPAPARRATLPGRGGHPAGRPARGRRLPARRRRTRALPARGGSAVSCPGGSATASAERCHLSSSSCCCSPGCRRPPGASCPWWLAVPACRGSQCDPAAADRRRGRGRRVRAVAADRMDPGRAGAVRSAVRRRRPGLDTRPGRPAGCSPPSSRSRCSGPCCTCCSLWGSGPVSPARSPRRRGLGWWAAAGCVAVAGAGLAAAVEVVRRLVVRISVDRAAGAAHMNEFPLLRPACSGRCCSPRPCSPATR